MSDKLNSQFTDLTGMFSEKEAKEIEAALKKEPVLHMLFLTYTTKLHSLKAEMNVQDKQHIAEDDVDITSVLEPESEEPLIREICEGLKRSGSEGKIGYTHSFLSIIKAAYLKQPLPQHLNDQPALRRVYASATKSIHGDFAENKSEK